MTVKLLMDWPDSRDGKQYIAGNLLTTDAGTEAGLVAANMATTTLTGGTAYVAPAVQPQYNPVFATKDLTGGLELIGPDGSVTRRVRRTPVRVATFGDSTAATGTAAGGISDCGVVTAPFPASGATIVGLNQTPKFLLQTVYPQAYQVADCGITGTTTASMLLRDSGSYTATRKAMKDALDLAPDVILLRAGSPNDFGSVTSGTWQAAADATYLNHKVLVSRAVSGGAIVIDEGFYGYGDGAGATATDPDSVRMAVLYLNSLYKSHAATLPGRVFFLDPQAAGIQQSDGRYVAGVSYDGVHLGAVGGRRIAKAEAAILTSVFGPSSGVRYPGANLIANAMFQDASAGLATGITLPSPTNGAWTGTAIEFIAGQNWQTSVFTPTAAGAIGIMSLYAMINAIIQTSSLNDVIGLEYDVMISGLGVAPAPTSVYGQIDIVKTGNGRIVEYCTMGYDTDTDTYFGHLAFQPLKLQDVTTIAGNGATSTGFFFKTDTVSPVKIGMSNPRLVKLNQPVVTV